MTNKIAIHNAETNETEIREMTKEELKAYEAQMASIVTIEDLEASKIALESKKQEVLAKLGLNADEISALLA